MLSREQNEESHLSALIALQLFKDLVKMYTFDQTVALCNPENCPLEPDFISCINDASFKTHLSDITHEYVAKFIDSALGVREEGATEFGFSTLDDGEVLTIVI